jgi:hypothetical protein
MECNEILRANMEKDLTLATLKNEKQRHCWK